MIEIKISVDSAAELRHHLRELGEALLPPEAPVLRAVTADDLAAAVAEGPGRAVPPQEEPKAKRGRKAAAEKEPAPTPEPVAEEPEPAIRATPEDRQPVAEVEQIEEAEVVASSAPPSLDDLKAAMTKVQEVRGMDWLVKNVQTLLGAPRASVVADEDRAAAIARLEEAARG